MIDKDAIAFGRIIERNILIGNFTGCTAILIPDIHGLAIFYHRGKPFPKAINQLANT